MKKLFILLFTIAIANMGLAQGLTGINYQAVARNLNGTVLVNKPIQVRFTITQGNTSIIQYQENQNALTNAYGLFNLVIGKGVPVVGAFSTVPWFNTNQWLQVEVSVAGGALTNLGKNPFNAVPFALMAAAAAPAGPAGGSLTGTYPNPTVANGAITQVMIAPGVTLPPSGAAGGELTGMYPNPNLSNTTVGAGSYGNAANYPTFTVDAKGRLTTAGQLALPTTLPPSGAAGGDLAGSTYPNPIIAPLVVTTNKIADGAVTSQKITAPFVKNQANASPLIDMTNSGAGAGIAATNTGTGSAASFSNTNAANAASTVFVNSNATTGLGLQVNQTGAGQTNAIYGSTTTNTGGSAAISGADFSSGGASPIESRTYGLLGQTGTTGIAVGGYAGSGGTALRASGGGATGWALNTTGRVQLTGINEAANRVLTSDAAGNATWQTLGAGVGVGGGGTLNKIPKWTPNGTTLGNSILEESASVIGVNTPAAYSYINNQKGLELYNDQANVQTRLVLRDNSDGDDLLAVVDARTSPTPVNSSMQLGTISNHPVTLFANGSEKIRLQPTGELSINDNATNAKLVVTGQGSTNYNSTGIGDVKSSILANNYVNRTTGINAALTIGAKNSTFRNIGLNIEMLQNDGISAQRYIGSATTGNLTTRGPVIGTSSDITNLYDGLVVGTDGYYTGPGEVIGNEVFAVSSNDKATGFIGWVSGKSFSVGMRQHVYSDYIAYGVQASASTTATGGRTVGGDFNAYTANTISNPLTVVGIYSTVTSGNVTSVNNLDAVANPGGYFESNGGQGIYATATKAYTNPSFSQPLAQGVVGVATTAGAGIGNQQGVLGVASNGSAYNFGIYGIVRGPAALTNNAAIIGVDLIGTANSYAGYFTGKLTATGTKMFTIDHPLDPANKILHHAAIESNEVLNMYSGNITTNATGFATVLLPDYFEALNKDFRYQLTVIGSFAQAIVKTKVSGNKFIIETSQPNIEVSWEVKGVRNDAWMKNNPMVVEETKADEAKGKYIYPQGFGKGNEASMLGMNGDGNEANPSLPKIEMPTLPKSAIALDDVKKNAAKANAANAATAEKQVVNNSTVDTAPKN